MRRRVLSGLFGVVLVSCAAVPASTCAPSARGPVCLRRASAAAYAGRVSVAAYAGRVSVAAYAGRVSVAAYAGRVSVAAYAGRVSAVAYAGRVSAVTYAGRVSAVASNGRAPGAAYNGRASGAASNGRASGAAYDGGGAATRRGRPRDPDELSAPQVAAMLRDFTRTLRRRYSVDSERQLESSRRRAGRIVIPVRFHVITDGRSGLLTRPVIDAQVRSLNAAYGGATGGADTGVSFRLVSAGVVTNPRWFARPHEEEGQMLGALSRGGPGTLNLYTAAVGSDVLGFSSFPESYRLHPRMDGVVVDYRSVPGGSFTHFNRGYTAVHETGHWLGLFHPFEGGCTPPGDGVDDTPYESVPTLYCPQAKDTCPEPGTDPVHNFMDYAWDTCMSSFTPGQGLRIRAMWAAYRANTGAGQRLRGRRKIR